ncbi:MAG: M50 family metallopeptidase [Oscillospiraceae bacterium]|nr:M50 family metallopeptidase [Oscillospiraceae bacterium]
MYILLAILIFSVLIVIHEFGHFVAAKACGVQVNEFSIFMGPKLLQKKGKETTYTLRLIPIGGYCAMEGEDDTSENPRAFTSAKFWKRATILVAGSFMNFLLGFAIVLCLYASADAFAVPVIDSFYEGCPYESAEAFQVGDRILSVDGKAIYLYTDLDMFLSRSTEQVYDIVVERDGREVELKDFSMPKVAYEVDGQTEYRYGFYFGHEGATLGVRLRNAWYTSVDFARMVWISLGDLIGGKVSINDMSGPVGIVSVISETGESAESTAAGVSDVLYLGAFIAVNLAVMNMLPIPALDGGRIFLLIITCAVEAVTRKKVNPKYEGYIHAAGMILLLAFMAFITLKDVIKLVR